MLRTNQLIIWLGIGRSSFCDKLVVLLLAMSLVINNYTLTLPMLLAGYLVIINLITLVLFWFDKWMARSGGWRIPEMILWIVTFLGGSIGALLAMSWFRHKTKKLSFQFMIALILLVHAGVVVWLLQYYFQK